MADDAASGFALLERAAEAGLGSLVVLISPDVQQLAGAFPVVPKGELLSSPVPAVTPEGYGYDPQKGELWFAGRDGRGRAAGAAGAEARDRRRAG